MKSKVGGSKYVFSQIHHVTDLKKNVALLQAKTIGHFFPFIYCLSEIIKQQSSLFFGS